MKWVVEKEVEGKVVMRKEGMLTDPYKKLLLATDDTRGAAKVSVGYGQSTEFAREKYNIQVTLSCDQNKTKLAEATDVAIDTIKELNEKVQKGLFG